MTGRVGRQECRAQGPKELIGSRDYFVWEPHCALVKATAKSREGVEVMFGTELAPRNQVAGSESSDLAWNQDFMV